MSQSLINDKPNIGEKSNTDSFADQNKFEQSSTQTIVKETLQALSQFQTEVDNKNAPRPLKEDKWQIRLNDLRTSLVELSRSMSTMTRSPSAEFSRRIGGGLGGVHSQIQHRVRTMVSGSPNTPVREYLSSQRNKPTVIRLLDKFAFLWGVLSLMVSEYVLFACPQYFWLWYTIFMGSMLAARFPAYYKKKWHYFLLDFCYFAQVWNFYFFFLFHIITVVFASSFCLYCYSNLCLFHSLHFSF
jgi:hypothetical protein